jgi:predicted transposase/invertase (TIGR01784 family)
MTVIHLDENDDLIDIRRDNVFKAVFTKDSVESRKALAALISAIIEREVAIVAITANEPSVDSVGERQIRFDIACRADDNEFVDIEMSLNPENYEPVRLEYYAGKLFTSQNVRGKDKGYQNLKMTYQIAFLVNGHYFGDDEYLHHFEYYDSEHGVGLGGLTRIITIELAKLGRTVEKAAGEMTKPEKWAVYFRYLTDKTKRDKINKLIDNEEGIAMASRVLVTISRDEKEQARLMSEFKYEVDTQSRIINAERRGEQKGIQKGKLEIAKILKDMGESVDRIILVTGLSFEDIVKL